ncbi:MAG: signal recognition particle-docking protein FtsY [Methanobrevibacter sp.]|uniref:signal recognition particle-docking protein FtsY n=1 Tax=Methanobrevibacter sp. TaxID=66852 RepID=UPI001B0EA4BC|nr:signal recognition particle-docking protein FtsY [Methanobrevibacter sp.]MBO5152461.1 signal recognition particle-docking protein FtsY [Methanobrevibacter sp.]
MFESLKKKLSRTSDKLEEEIIEEAKQEDNLQEEKGKKRSFFSFGRRKEEKKEEIDESALLETSSDEVQTEEVEEEKKSRFSFMNRDKDESVEEDVVEEVKEEKKSHFWSRNKDNDESDEEENIDEVTEEKSDSLSENEDESPEQLVDEVEEVKEEKKSHFWSRNKDNDESDEESEDDKEEEKSHFWSRNKNKDDEDSDEGSGGLFSFVREKTISEKHVEDTLWELEMGLLEGDVAMEVATEVVDSVKEDLVGRKIKRSSDITEYTYNALRNAVAEIIDIPGKSMTEMIEEKKAQGEPLVVMFVGINGTGKTTTIGKLANYYLKKGYTPVIAASDTFRAGAIEQVTHHADNVGVKIIKHQKGSDPAAVAFDAVEHAKAQGKELVLIDTAGRMQTNTNLMDEMKKIKRVSNPDLVIFVGDALTGNDATQQAAKFNEAIDIDGVILTKADADSKGGASLSIGYVIKKPIMFLGVGQGYDDIMEYDADWMLNQLFGEDDGVAAEE